MSTPDDAHARRNLEQMKQLERAQSIRLLRTHNGVISAIEVVDEKLHEELLDEDQLEVLQDALGQLEAVADSIAVDERIHDDRLLATLEGSS